MERKWGGKKEGECCKKGGGREGDSGKASLKASQARARASAELQSIDPSTAASRPPSLPAVRVLPSILSSAFPPCSPPSFLHFPTIFLPFSGFPLDLSWFFSGFPSLFPLFFLLFLFPFFSWFFHFFDFFEISLFSVFSFFDVFHVSSESLVDFFGFSEEKPSTNLVSIAREKPQEPISRILPI